MVAKIADNNDIINVTEFIDVDVSHYSKKTREDWLSISSITQHFWARLKVVLNAKNLGSIDIHSLNFRTFSTAVFPTVKLFVCKWKSLSLS